MLDFMMYITMPDGLTPVIGDDDGGRCLPHGAGAPNDFRAVLFERRRFFSNVATTNLFPAIFAAESLWLFGRDGLDYYRQIRTYEPRNSSRFFADGGYFVMRDGWNETDNFLLVDAGEVGSLNGGHGHSDALSIVTAVGGRTTLIDPGTYTYHESAEMRDFFRTSVAHNTLLIDEQSQSEPGGKFSWQSRANVRIQSRISEERFDFL